MMPNKTSVALLLVLTAVVSGYAYQAARPWPPGLQKVSDESPVLSAEDEMKTFFISQRDELEIASAAEAARRRKPTA